MSETENKTSADELVKEALETVKKLEEERGAAPADAAAESTTDDDELDLDNVSFVKGDGSTETLQETEDAAEASEADGGDEEILIEDDDAPAAPPKADPMLQAMIAAKNELQEVLAQTQKEAKSMKERLTRVSADFENYKKRQAREKAEAIQFANEKLLKELMPVLDNMERAMDASKTAIESGAENAAENLMEGTSMVLKQFTETLAKFGIKPFSAFGKKFDPALHEAVGAREDASVPNQTVLEEYQRGYMLNDRLARPAMVVVSSGGPAESAAKPAAEEAPDAADAEQGDPDGGGEDADG